MSVISGTIAAKEQSKTAKQQNKSQLALELAARGAKLSGKGVPAELVGSEAALLPYYFGNTERELAGDASAIYEALRGRAPSIADYEEIFRKYDPAYEIADQAAIDMVTGRATEQDLAEAQPVFNARTGAAEARMNAGLEALRETLAENDAIQAGKGYSGDSTGNRMMRFNARREIGSAAAQDLANVKLLNELEKQGILKSGRERSAMGGEILGALQRMQVGRKQAPGMAVISDQQNAMLPFQFFNMGPHQFTPPNLVSEKAGIANAIGQTTSTVGGALLKYNLDRNLEQQQLAKKRGGYNYGFGGSSSGSSSGGGGGGAPAGTTYDSNFSYAPNTNVWANSY